MKVVLFFENGLGQFCPKIDSQVVVKKVNDRIMKTLAEDESHRAKMLIGENLILIRINIK